MKRLLQTAIVIVTTIGVQACEGPRDIGPRQQVAAIADIPSDTSITEQMRVCLGMFNEYAVNSEMERYFHDISSVTKDEVCNSIREMRDLEGNAIINGSVFSGSDRQRFEETACNTSETLIKYIRDGEYTSEWLSDRFYESFDRCLAIPSTQIRAPRLSVRASLIDQGNRVRFLLRAIEPHPIHGFKIGMSSRGLHTCNAIQNGTALRTQPHQGQPYSTAADVTQRGHFGPIRGNLRAIVLGTDPVQIECSRETRNGGTEQIDCSNNTCRWHGQELLEVAVNFGAYYNIGYPEWSDTGDNQGYSFEYPAIPATGPSHLWIATDVDIAMSRWVHRNGQTWGNHQAWHNPSPDSHPNLPDGIQNNWALVSTEADDVECRDGEPSDWSPSVTELQNAYQNDAAHLLPTALLHTDDNIHLESWRTACQVIWQAGRCHVRAIQWWDGGNPVQESTAPRSAPSSPRAEGGLHQANALVNERGDGFRGWFRCDIHRVGHETNVVNQNTNNQRGELVFGEPAPRLSGN